MQKFRRLTKYSEDNQVNDIDRGVIDLNYRPLQVGYYYFNEISSHRLTSLKLIIT